MHGKLNLDLASCADRQSGIRQTGSLPAAKDRAPWAELTIENVSMTFNSGKANEYRALDGANLRIGRGEFYCLLGPSGCGKSTILNLVAGFIRPSSGSLRIGDRQITEPGTDRVVVFQDVGNALFPWLRAIENVAFGLTLKGRRAPSPRSAPTVILISLASGITPGNSPTSSPAA